MLEIPASFVPLIVAPAAATPLTLLLHRHLLLLRDSDLGLPDAAAIASVAGVVAPAHALGLWHGVYCQAAWVDAPELPPAPPGHAWHGLRALFGRADEALLGIAARAVQITEWARTHRYCGACATPTLLLAGERCYRCPACGHAAYPRISPAMMVLIRKGDAVLLALHTAAASQRYTPLAGFLEAGESIEQAVHREVFEEVGLRVHNLQYFASQAWPFPHSLMIAFTADYLDGEIRVDASEIADARWFGPHDAWPEPVPHVSISSVLVDAHRPGGSHHVGAG